MKHLVAAALTLTVIVAGILMTTSLSSSAQEDGGTDQATTTTTIAEPDPLDHFELRFGGDLPAEVDEFLSCLEDEGVVLPEEFEGSFRFGLGGEDIEGLSEALEVCGLPGIGHRFDGEFPFGGEFPEGFSFDELPEGFPFGEGFGGGFGLEFRDHRVDRDQLASCLAELGSFESVDEVRAQLDECLPEPPDFEDLEGFAPFGRGKHGEGFPFGGSFSFGFEAPAPEVDGT